MKNSNSDVSKIIATIYSIIGTCSCKTRMFASSYYLGEKNWDYRILRHFSYKKMSDEECTLASSSKYHDLWLLSNLGRGSDSSHAPKTFRVWHAICSIRIRKWVCQIHINIILIGICRRRFPAEDCGHKTYDTTCNGLPSLIGRCWRRHSRRANKYNIIFLLRFDTLKLLTSTSEHIPRLSIINIVTSIVAKL